MQLAFVAYPDTIIDQFFHFDIELSIDDWTAIGQYIMKGPSLRYLDLKDLVLGSEHIGSLHQLLREFH